MNIKTLKSIALLGILGIFLIAPVLPSRASAQSVGDNTLGSTKQALIQLLTQLLAQLTQELNTLIANQHNAGTIINSPVGPEKEPVQPPIIEMCDYIAPPIGCSYSQGQNYNATTKCGMVLSCTNDSGRGTNQGSTTTATNQNTISVSASNVTVGGTSAPSQIPFGWSANYTTPWQLTATLYNSSGAQIATKSFSSAGVTSGNSAITAYTGAYSSVLDGSLTSGQYKITVCDNTLTPICGTSANFTITVSAIAQVSVPKITSISPTSGPSGTLVTIIGSGFSKTSLNTINFNGPMSGKNTATTSSDGTTLKFNFPALSCVTNYNKDTSAQGTIPCSGIPVSVSVGNYSSNTVYFQLTASSTAYAVPSTLTASALISIESVLNSISAILSNLVGFH